MAVFKKEFGNFDISKITSEEIMGFLINVSEGQKQTTKKLKYSLLKALFNFIKDSVDLSLINPCDSPILRKTFKVAKGQPWTILDRDVVDEIIFKTDNFRNRLMLELMARGGMRVGEVLKLKAKNVYDRKLFLSDPKSGRQVEIVSKIILRHANLATTQRYLGKVSDTEAIYWIENIYK